MQEGGEYRLRNGERARERGHLIVHLTLLNKQNSSRRDDLMDCFSSKNTKFTPSLSQTPRGMIPCRFYLECRGSHASSHPNLDFFSFSFLCWVIFRGVPSCFFPISEGPIHPFFFPLAAPPSGYGHIERQMTAFGVCKGLFLWGHQAQVTTGSCAQLRTVLPQENPVGTDMMITKHTRGALDAQAVPCVQNIWDLLGISD